jgi:hypothetical protein
MKTIHLVDGRYTAAQTTDLVTQLVQVKISFLEKLIQKSSEEEEVKMRETRIKALQEELRDLKQTIGTLGDSLDIHASISVGA